MVNNPCFSKFSFTMKFTYLKKLKVSLTMGSSPIIVLIFLFTQVAEIVSTGGRANEAALEFYTN